MYIQGYKHHIALRIQSPPKDIPDGMVYIPGGTFRMGDKDAKDSMGGADELPHHDVQGDGFFMDRYEVSNAQYRQCVKAGACAEEPHYEDGTCYRFTPSGWQPVKVEPAFQEDAKPVVCVDWFEAQAYCAYMKKHLPTEAEWEKAAAGPSGYTWSIGPVFDGSKANSCDRECDYAAWKDDEIDDGYKFSAPIGTYAVNSYGLYDMSGNVAEWVADWYDEQFYGKPEATKKNPVNDKESQDGRRVLRGGSWINHTELLRVASRGRIWPYFRNDVVGFRCVVRPPQ